MTRSLLPREHGAYVQLLAPLSVALLRGDGDPAGLLFALGAALAFAANEPLLVTLGHRGRRAREQSGPRARRLLWLLAPGAALASGAGFALAPPAARAMAAAALAPVAALLALAWRKQERSLPGELVAAGALPGAAAPVAVAAGAPWPDAALLWAAWSCGYACTVIAVHRVIAQHRRGPARLDRLAAVGLAAAALAALALAVAVSLAHALAALPLAAASAAVVIAAPPATRLRAIGLSLLGASLISVALVLALVPG